MKTFVDLVDSNAQIAAYKKNLGLTKDEVKAHLGNIRFYREIAMLSTEIKELFKDKENNYSHIKILRGRLNDVIKEWKDGKV